MASSPILLSSSPCGAGMTSVHFGRSSSPDLPTLEEILSQKSTTKATGTGSSLAGIDSNALSRQPGAEAAASKTTAKELGWEDAEVEDADVSLAEISHDDYLSSRSMLPPMRPPAIPKPSLNNRETVQPTEKTTKARRAPNTEKPTSIPKARGIPAAEKDKEAIIAKPKKKQTGAASKHFKPPPPPPKAPTIPDEPLNIQSAMTRRVDWTPPPKDSLVEFGSRSSDVVELLSSSVKPAEPAQSREVFKKLQDTYGYELQDELPPRVGSEERDAEGLFRKRKRIEMVSTTSATVLMPPPDKSPSKSKAPRKKARTITDLATAAYAPKEQDPPNPPVLEVEAQGPKPKPKARVAKKTKAKTAKKKDDPRMVLLSPQAALAQVAKQDFVFGTSSQLVRELHQDDEDDGMSLPRLRKDPLAVVDEEAFETPVNSDAIEPPERRPRLWDAAARDEDGELLHLDVIDLVDSPAAEVTHEDSDPFGYVIPDRKQSQRPSSTAVEPISKTRGASPSRPTASLPSKSTTTQSAPSWARPTQPPIPIEDSVYDAILGYTSSTSPPPSSQKRLPRIYELDPPPAAAPLPTSTPASNSTRQKSRSISPTKEAAPPADVPVRPKFELYTDAQLAGQVASYGFKPIKKRDAMISLLDQCWASKHQRQLGGGARGYSTASAASASTVPGGSALAEVSAEMAPPSSQAAAPAKRPRGRPRKNSATSTAAPPSSQPPAEVLLKRPRGRPRKNTTPPPPTPPKKKTQAPKVPKKRPSTPPRKRAPVMEFPDTDDSDLSTPSSPEPIFSSPSQHDTSLPTEADLSISLDDPSTSTSEKQGLHACITKAVTSAPRSKDPSRPSWHEKMLMYESVIVEDLAVWLNTGPLGEAGWDGEVSGFDVKGWCEEKSVCCVWRERIGGKERKRL